jgi:hypothetical protein
LQRAPGLSLFVDRIALLCAAEVAIHLGILCFTSFTTAERERKRERELYYCIILLCAAEVAIHLGILFFTSFTTAERDRGGGRERALPLLYSCCARLRSRFTAISSALLALLLLRERERERE